MTIVGLGLLGGSLAMAVRRTRPGTRIIGYAHRPATRRLARRLKVVDDVTGDLQEAVGDSQMVVLATPLSTFPSLMAGMAGALSPGAVVTDVGSTKVQVHAWAMEYLPKGIEFVGSHPMAGSEQRGLAAARADLFSGALCFVTSGRSDKGAGKGLVVDLWQELGCRVCQINPVRHDRIVAGISHVPQAVAVALVNATNGRYIQFAGRGFKDTTRIASSDPRIWTDIFMTNAANVKGGLDKVIRQLQSLQRSIGSMDRTGIRHHLAKARLKRRPIASF
ncbi:MAG: prephenate dehydrogenase/arogenate dehydrogenase family protein [Sedimentisphaerales bacterium]|nr:prephenate dehydrogenase/arogenate dehydrogenase family protein [Sedimentisphaerales bacterium]